MQAAISMPQIHASAIKTEAVRLGFAECRITIPDAIPDAPQRLQAWLAAGHHGSMEWMEIRADQRSDPAILWGDVRSVIMLGMSYAPEEDPMALVAHPDRARISAYAQGKDYHDVVKKALKALARWIVEQAGGIEAAQVKVFVDTAPVMEKPLAAAAGLGWQGKHSNLVSRTQGSWLFLGSIYTTLDLPADPPEIDHCGSCTACHEACPTDAFSAPYIVDARRCISYLTIEHKGSIPDEFRAAMGNRIYGCDDCLAVCPWNKFAQSAAAHKAFLPRAELAAPRLADLLLLDDAAFRVLFSGSPIKRIGRNRFIRNCLIAAGNSGDAAMLSRITPLLNDPDPVVVEAAYWAHAKLQKSSETPA
jgi:epoxyqueuosine reductase